MKGYDEINATLEEIHTEEDEKPEAKHEAGILASDMNRLEIVILAALWHQILQRATGQIKLCNQPIKTLTAPLLYLSR